MLYAFKTIPFLPVHLGNAASKDVILLFIPSNRHWKCSGFSSDCCRLMHPCQSLILYVPMFLQQLVQVCTNAAKKIKQVWKQEEMVTLLHKILYRKTSHLLLSSPFPLKSQANFWGAGEGCHVRVFLLTAFNWEWCHTFLAFRHH